MPFLIDEAHLPATLTTGPMSDEEFSSLCGEHPGLTFETTAEGELVITPQTYTLTGARNNQIAVQLGQWAWEDGSGLSFDSSTGWVLPDSSRRSPDGAWISQARAGQVPENAREGFWHVCPEFVIELRSSSDRLQTLRKKMENWMANGVRLGWLIDPERRAVEIYRPGRHPEILEGIDALPGEGPVSGFTLDLRRVWSPYPNRQSVA